MHIAFAGLDGAAASVERALNGLLTVITPRGHELIAFPYVEKVRILHACWPVVDTEADAICQALMRLGALQRKATEDAPREQVERELALLLQAYHAIRIVGADAEAGFRTIAVHLCGLLDNAADAVIRARDPQERASA